MLKTKFYSTFWDVVFYGICSVEDVWEVLQSQFEKSQDINLPLNENNQLHELSQDGTQFQFYQNGNGKQQYSSNQGNGGSNGHFITNGGSIGNGNNGSSSSSKTVMDINGRKKIDIFKN